MEFFLMKFDRPTADLQVEVFSDGSSAMKRRFELERDRSSTTLEIVVIGAESLDSIRVTHPRYFRAERRARANRNFARLASRRREHAADRLSKSAAAVASAVPSA